MPEWISTKDRLPEKRGNYLCVTKRFCGFRYIKIYGYTDNLYSVDKYDFYDRKNKRGFYDYDEEYGYYEIDDVSRWMPLPELPKGE